MSRAVSLERINGFGKIAYLPPVKVNQSTAGSRLTALKQKFNQFEEKRSTLHKQQHTAAGSSRKRERDINSIVKLMERCITQINTLRAEFGSILERSRIEFKCTMKKSAFKQNETFKKLLKGGL